MHLNSIATVLVLAARTLACGLLHGRSPVDTAPQFAPLPPTAVGLPLGPGGYASPTRSTNDTNLALTFFLISNEGVIAVDCPPTIGHLMLYAIRNITSIKITYLIYSHYHADHIGGVWIFGDEVKTIAHIETARHLLMTPDSNRPLPKETFTDTYKLCVGNQTLELAYKGEVHLSGNIFIYAPAQKILILIDVVFPDWVPFALLGQTKNAPAFFHAHDQILEYDFDPYIGSHLGRSGNRTDVLIQQEYIHDLKHSCELAVNGSATNDSTIGVAALLGPVSEKNPHNMWANFKVYLDTLAQFCANKTNEKWLSRLGAADVFEFENAGLLVESLRIDYGILGPFGTM
ncbi:uncharacterized protein PAC_06280 [Phialocephala subalpina]|uniref:Metallo-beta-lactamase domain-containing protein n=1 Tax=Phialocephala subalpina TaxID=576137 RepID=A0A1L7WUD5_9HELO|nr:uncharacterized protein PAC_06280 [Phialocephala subalpina]